MSSRAPRAHAVTAVALMVLMIVSASALQGPAPAAAATTQAPIRINAGGPAGTFEGKAYQADTWFVGGTTSLSKDPVAGTASSALYQARRIGPSGYSIPVLAGTYDVTVATAETWFTSAGARRFSATAEGSAVFTDLDLYRTVGHDTAYRVTTRVLVTDGRLDLAFSASVNKAVVAAITVLPVTTTTTTTTTTTPVPTPTPTTAVASAPRLEIAPPVLDNPETVYLTPTNLAPRLDPTKDYRLVIKDGLLDVGTGTLEIGGGRSSVLVGGEIRSTASSRPLMIRRVTGAEGGHVYVEGIRITSSTGVGKEGVNVDVRTRGTRYTLQNIRIDPIDGSYSGHHADLVQTWGGNEDGLFRINRMTGFSGYQDLMLNPGQYGYGDSSLLYRFTHVVAEHDAEGGVMVYAASATPEPGRYRIEVADVTLAHPAKTVIDSSVFVGLWHVADRTGLRLVQPGVAASPLLGSPGRWYVSPGYVG